MRNERGQSEMPTDRTVASTRLGDAKASVVLVTAAVSLALLLLASQAGAAYQQLPAPNGCFAGTGTNPCGPVSEENFGEEVQLGGVESMAVNTTGAGGVPKGTVYAATVISKGAGTDRVAMFFPAAGGGLKFVEGWTVSLKESYERCGKLLGTEMVGGKEVVKFPCNPRVKGGPQEEVGIDVDQTTGNVIVYAGALNQEDATGNLIVSYSADGSEVIARFGEKAPLGETVADSPDKVHASFASDMLAVSPSGDVYVYDEVGIGEMYQRLMVFSPNNDHTAYDYAGEVAGGSLLLRKPKAPVFDQAGNLYVAGIEGGGDRIEALSAEDPGGYPTKALAVRCEYKYPKGGLTAMTVDPKTGEPFFFSEKAPKRVRRLGPCNEGTHEFAGSATPEELTLSPERGDLYALAFDPTRQADPSRPPGVLYGGTLSPTPSGGTGTGEPGQSSLGYVFAPPQQLEPSVKGEFIAHVTTNSAVAQAKIDPNGFRTHFAFQYLTQAEWEAAGESFAGAKEAPIGGGQIEAAGGVQSVAAALGQLLPSTDYRFRVVITSLCKGDAEPVCEKVGEPFAFRTYPAGLVGPPDSRAWELVSPAQKNGGQVIPAAPNINACGGCKPGQTYAIFPMQSAADGNSVAYEGTNFGTEGSTIENAYVAQRNPLSGWASTDVTQKVQRRGAGLQSFASQFKVSVLLQKGEAALVAGGPSGYANIYAQGTGLGPGPLPLVASPPPHRTGGTFKLAYAAISADGSRIFFAANDTLTPDAPIGDASQFNLYEWHEGALSLVNVMPGGDPKVGGSFGTASQNTVSEDGSHAYFSDEAGQVYVRIDGRETRRIEDGGHFVVASTDGSKVLLSDGCLYTIAAESCLDLTEGKGGFEGASGQSLDLSHVYFVDNAVLPGTAGEESCRPGPRGVICEQAEAGKHNLYAWQQQSPVRFVATLESHDNDNEGEGGGIADWVANPAKRTAQASPAGRYLAFLTRRELTSYQNIGPCESDNAGGTVPDHCPEAYLYDSVANRLVCASCNPSGSAPLGYSVLRRIKEGGDFLQPRYLTDEGRLYFDTQDSLSPFDSNEGLEDVYEYHPFGIDRCSQEEGCVSLISAGREASDSNFVAINEGTATARAGSDVFFTTRDRLVKSDTDEQFDLYDAREGGGIPEEEPLLPCQGETCQGPPAPSVEAGAIPTQGLQGSGNYVAPKCSNGKVLKKGKCTKKRSGKKHKKKNGSNRKKGGLR